MTKIRANVRGDSGLSDSQVVKTQIFFHKKTQEALDELEEYGIMESNRRRFEANAKPPRKTLWSRIKSWVTK